MSSGCNDTGNSASVHRFQKTTSRIIKQYNALDIGDLEGRRKILDELLNPACRGQEQFFESFLYVQTGYNLTVGHNFFCVFLDTAPIKFGDNCIVGPTVHIYTGSHSLDGKDRLEYMMSYPISYPVEIGNNVWIGGRSFVCLGVTVGDNVVAAAGSSVIRDVPSIVVIGGSPAEIIRQLDVK